MTPKVTKLYKSALKNDAFLSDMLDADGDSPPSMWDNNGKTFFATMYYGWIIGRYGTDWEKYI